MPTKRKLRVFLCHASQDKPIVRDVYQRLLAEGWIDPWLDEEKLLPGQDWDMEIEKAVEAADTVVVCLSNNSVNKDGYVQKELRYILDIADEKTEEKIYIIPLRFDDCLRPRRLKKWQYVDFFPKPRKDWAYQRLIESMKLCATRIDINFFVKFNPNSILSSPVINENPQLEKPIIFEPETGSKVDLVFSLKCSEVRGAEKYIIYYKKYGDKVWTIYDVTGYSFTQQKGQCQFKLTANYPGTYFLRVKVFDKFGHDSVSDPVIVEVLD
jgi:hypothetical protein